MIKINLLPTKKKPPKKVTELQQQLILGTLILALTGIGMWFYWNSLNSKINALNRDKAAAEERIQQQDNLLKEVNSVEEERKKVADKIAIIEQLKTDQGLLVHLLDELSKSLPKGVSLASLSETGGLIEVEGSGFTNHDIVRFVDNLKACPYCLDVFLLETSQVTEGGIDIYKYKLKFTFKGV